MKLIRSMRESFSARLLLLIMLTMTIPMAAFSIFFISSFHTIYNEKHQSSVLRETTDLSLNMNSQLRALSNYLSLLCQDDSIRECVDNWSGIENDVSNLRSAINHNNFASPHLIDTDIAILTPSGRLIYGEATLRGIAPVKTFYVFAQKAYSPAYRGMVWFTDRQLSPDTKSDVEYCFVAAPIREIRYGIPHGFIMLRMRKSSLVSMYLAETDTATNFFVLDVDGSIIASADTMEVSNVISGPLNPTIMQAPNNIDANDYMLYPIKLSNSWVLVSITQARAMSAEMNSKTYTFLLALIVIVILTLATAYFISKRFVRPIASMIVQMDNVAAGDLSSHVAINSHDELAQLADHYNRMIDRLQKSVEQIVVEQEEKRKSDIIALQMQINPHFLMNTLSSIRYMVYNFRPEEIDRMILALNKILKYALSNTGEYATLSMEFEQLRNYMTIQKSGFDAPLHYEISLAPNLEDYRIIKLLLQPLVENAVLHGLKTLDDNPTLIVNAVPCGKDKIIIVIKDNGCGFDGQKAIEQLKNGTFSGIGLNNVYKRLLLHYGENFDLHIYSRENCPGGTEIEITIPAEKIKEPIS